MSNQELERVSKILEQRIGMEKETIYKVVRWGWDEVTSVLEGMDCVSVEFPKFGQWIVTYRTLNGIVSHLYDHLVYKKERIYEKNYSLLTNKFLKLKQFLELVDNKIKDGYKVNYKKPVAYYGGNKKLPNNKG